MTLAFATDLFDLVGYVFNDTDLEEIFMHEVTYTSNEHGLDCPYDVEMYLIDRAYNDPTHVYHWAVKG